MTVNAINGSLNSTLSAVDGVTLSTLSAINGQSLAVSADSPDDISGLLLWFKADAGVFSDAGSTAANNGDTVQQWNDQSGNAIHASQATSGSRPTYRTNQINSLPAVDFATSKWMSFATQSFTNCTIFAVCKQGSAAAVTKTVIGGSSDAKVRIDFETYNLEIRQSSGRVLISGEEMPVSDFVQVCLRQDGTSSIARVDEVQVGTGAAAASTDISHIATRLNSGTATEFLNGLIAEIIVYSNAISLADRAVVETYLRTKYALPNPAQTLTDPSTITGCKLWLEADAGAYNDAGSTLATDGQTVQQWNDQSGNGNNATQATSGNRPTFETNEINTTLPVLRFDGSNDSLEVPSFTIGTLVVLHKYATSGNYPDYKTPFNDRSLSDGRVMLFESGTTTLRSSSVINNRMFRNGTKTNSAAPINSFQICFGTWPGSGSLITDSYDIGRDDQNNARCWNGDIVAVIAYDRGLSPANRVRIQNYLNTKYAIF